MITEAADRVQRAAPLHSGGAAEECSVPEILPLLNNAVEHFAFAGHILEGVEVLFNRIGIHKEVRSLNKEKLRIPLEETDGLFKKISGWYMVGIQDQNQIAVNLGQGSIDVAGLSVKVTLPSDICDTEPDAKLLQFDVPRQRNSCLCGVRIVAFLDRSSVVEQVNLQFFPRIADLSRRDQRDS